MRAWIAVVLLAVTVAGCSSSARHPDAVTTTGAAATNPYAGPMHLPIVNNDEQAPVLDRSGAAGRALECVGKPYEGAAGGGYQDGLSEVASSAADALNDWDITGGAPEYRPSSGYRVERADAGRVLFSWDVAGRTEVAVIAANTITDYQHHTGWGIETWAQCDPAEFPATVTDSLGLGVWTARSGRRAPIAQVVSFPGLSWCDFDGTRLMNVGGSGPKDSYVYDSAHQLTQYTEKPFATLDAVPANATDAGYHRDGRELWSSSDKKAVYLVDTDDPTDVEQWPQLTPGTGCD